MPSEAPGKATSKVPTAVLPPDDVLFGQSEVMREVQQRAAKVSRANIPVLIEGDGGTGKEVLAKWIHQRSPFASGLFVKVNCAAIPGTLLESELFGYEKGTFTGANVSKPGRVELAHNGTLFLDEISDLDLSLQSKILHFLQDGRFSRIGDESERVVETRLICATNKDLEQEILSGRFRADLYYRINVVRMRLPRLRERREDIMALAQYFKKQHEAQFGKESLPFDSQMLDLLVRLEWPGNLRELSNRVARHVLMGPDEEILAESWKRRPSAGRASSEGETAIPLKRIAKDAVRDREHRMILEALRAHHWNRRRAAVALKISYRTLIYKIREAGFAGKRKGYSGEQETLANPLNPAAD